VYLVSVSGENWALNAKVFLQLARLPTELVRRAVYPKCQGRPTIMLYLRLVKYGALGCIGCSRDGVRTPSVSAVGASS
jgi:hypothetical protein